MSLTLATTPTKTVNGILSNAVALHGQIPFTFKRVDAVFDLTLELGFLSIVFSDLVNPELLDAQAGDSYNLGFVDDSPYDAGIYEGSAPIQTGANTFKITFEGITYIQNELNVEVNYITLYRNYNVSLNIFNNVTQELVIDSGVRYRPKADGNLFVDMSGLFFGIPLFLGYTSFKLSYTESYNSQDQAAVLSDSFIGLDANKQVMNDGGSNMWERLANEQNPVPFRAFEKSGLDRLNVVFHDATGLENYVVGDYLTINCPPYKGTYQITQKNLTFFFFELKTTFLGGAAARTGQSLGVISKPAGLFLTPFKNIIQWKYFSRTLTFLIDDDLLARTGGSSLRINVGRFDISGVLLGEQEVDYTGVGTHIFNFDPLLDASYYEATLLGGGALTNVVSEVIRVDQKEACKNPMLLEWLNEEGAFDQYVFDVNQLFEDSANEGLVIESPIVEDFSVSDSTVARYSTNNYQTITLTAENIPIDLFNALKFIKKSNKVNLYLDPLGVKKIGVAVFGTYNSDYESLDTLVNFTVKILTPSGFIFENSWR